VDRISSSFANPTDEDWLSLVDPSRWLTYTILCMLYYIAYWVDLIIQACSQKNLTHFALAST
jgi:hypothetical protein